MPGRVEPLDEIVGYQADGGLHVVKLRGDGFDNLPDKCRIVEDVFVDIQDRESICEDLSISARWRPVFLLGAFANLVEAHDLAAEILPRDRDRGRVRNNPAHEVGLAHPPPGNDRDAGELQLFLSYRR